MSKFPMTAAGHSALEDELKQRIRVERPRLVRRIQEAIADDSNLAENSEYQAAKAEQEINEARIVELEDKLARAEVIDVSKLFGDTIKFGATVTPDRRRYRREKGLADRWRAGSRREERKDFRDFTDRARVLDRIMYARTFVNADIVHHDDIAVFERRNQALLRPGTSLRSWPRRPPSGRLSHGGATVAIPCLLVQFRPTCCRAANLRVGHERSSPTSSIPG